MSEGQQLDRSMLDGKDREELHAIAAAMGVRGATRMRKADLVDVILGDGILGDVVRPDAPVQAPPVPDAREVAAIAASNGAIPEPAGAVRTKRVRSTRRPAGTDDDPLAAIAAEEAAPGAPAEPGSEGVGTTSAYVPVVAPANGGAYESAAAVSEDAPFATSDRSSAPRPDVVDGNRGHSGEEGGADGSRRRRRRRGRDRVPGAPGNEVHEPREGHEPRELRESVAEPVDCEGLLDLRDEGYGFLRSKGYLAGRADVYVSASQVRRFALRKGDHLEGATRPAASTEKYPALLRVDTVNGLTPDDARERPRFEDLTALFPDVKLKLELDDEPLQITGRIIDLIAPIGKGQRGLIVSPPKAGKTTVMKQIVSSIERNNPEVHLMVLLVDERPEEVTDMRRHVQRGEVVASTFDRPSEEHTHVAELAIERAKRLVELGRDVVVILDGITRLARAYNLATPASGRVLSGGVDSAALYPPKKFFGAARNIEEGGSLTIIATALVDTGSRMDEVIFEEFKGTGNMELRLDRRVAERRIYPAIDVVSSSTRQEQLLFDRDELQQVWKLRRVLNGLETEGRPGSGLELLIEKLRTTKRNREFLNEIAKAPSAG
jgi:transcription termination factor Rho